jgi:hypothetical protein
MDLHQASLAHPQLFVQLLTTTRITTKYRTRYIHASHTPFATPCAYPLVQLPGR